SKGDLSPLDPLPCEQACSQAHLLIERLRAAVARPTFPSKISRANHWQGAPLTPRSGEPTAEGGDPGEAADDAENRQQVEDRSKHRPSPHRAGHRTLATVHR